MTARRLAYLAVALASLSLAACSNTITGPTGPEVQPNVSIECRAIVGGGSTRC
ncbi:MAG TPA: hypothetical protein VJ672_04570 [Gemmatimonadaceae bacterium]|nr:hypothetical protein [Gemmatimonadaceae bacterium]